MKLQKKLMNGEAEKLMIAIKDFLGKELKNVFLEENIQRTTSSIGDEYKMISFNSYDSERDKEIADSQSVNDSGKGIHWYMKKQHIIKNGKGEHVCTICRSDRNNQNDRTKEISVVLPNGERINHNDYIADVEDGDQIPLADFIKKSSVTK